MRASSEAVEGNKIRLSVEIEESEVDQVLGEAVRTLSRQARVPGFRPGKVPRQVLEARMGGSVALRAEALREAIPDFYARALSEAELDPITPPEIDITAGREGGALAFDAIVEVRPVVPIPGYAGLEVTVPSPAVTDEDVDVQVDRLRDAEAELVEVGRPARDGDYLTIDLHGTSGTEELVSTDDLLYEVGSNRVVPALDEQLRGAKVGDVLAFTATPPGSTDGPQIAFRVLVKDVKEKKLPEVTDDWAAEASEFSTVAELRAGLRRRITQVKVVEAQLSLREGALTALVDLVDDEDVPEVLVDEEVSQRIHDLGHRLEEQRLGMAQFLEVTGRTEEELVAELRGEARQSVKGDLALRALADAEALEVTDDELDTELAAMADRLQLEPAIVRDRLTRGGRIAAVRSEQRKAKALTWLLDHVSLVDEEGAPVSRDDLRVDQSVEVDGPGEGSEDDESTDGAAEDDAGQVVAVTGTEATSGEAEP